MLRLAALLALFVALSFGAEVQGQPKIPRIGLLSVGTDPAGPLPPQWITFFERFSMRPMPSSTLVMS